MSGELAHITRSFENRMSLRRGMMRKVGIVDRPDLAQDLAAPLRETLLSCNRCAHPDLCAYWLSSTTRGAPMFCRARLAFQEIARATSRPSGTPVIRKPDHDADTIRDRAERRPN